MAKKNVPGGRLIGLIPEDKPKQDKPKQDKPDTKKPEPSK